MRHVRVVLLGILSFLIFMTCSKPRCIDPTFTEEAGHTLREWVEHDANPEGRRSPPPLDDLVVYLDTSQSMQGYTDPGGESEYARALEAVRDVVDELEPRHTLLYRRVAEEVGPLEVRDQTLRVAARESSFYTGGESNLGGAIRTFDQPDPTLDDGGGIARCHILVTDGVQHLKGGHGDDVCASGNDPRCVNDAVRDLIDRGWGAHVFGIRSRFDGPIYSEINQKWLPARHRASRLDETERYRPFLVYLFTNRSDYMPHLVDRFRKQLKRTGIREELIGELPLTLRLVETSDLEMRGDVYKMVDEFGAERENPVVWHREPAWREDMDGRLLDDNVEIFEYWGGEELTPQPFAIHVTANVEFTEAGRALFSRERADVGSLLQPVRVHRVPRPEHWYQSPSRGEEADQPEGRSLQGSGILADAEGTDKAGETPSGPSDEEEKTADGVEEESLFAWPPPGELKKLQLPDRLAEKLEPPFELVEDVTCTLNGGCHLVTRWSRRGECFPISLLRLEASLDPEKIPLPSWISDWSTRSDTSLEDANKILNLDRLVRGLLDNEQIASQGLEPRYVVLWPAEVE